MPSKQDQLAQPKSSATVNQPEGPRTAKKLAMTNLFEPRSMLAGQTLENMVDKLPKDKLRDILVETLRLLTRHIPGDLSTSNDYLASILSRTRGQWQPPSGNYSGDIVCGVANGQGVLTSGNKGMYDGHFINGVKHGKGMQMEPKSETYTGDFANGVKQGLGRVVNSTGNDYYGSFKEDKREGPGLKVFKDGITVFSVYHEGKLHGQSMYVSHDKQSMGYCTYSHGQLEGKRYIYKLDWTEQ